MTVEAPPEKILVEDYGLEVVRDMLSVKRNGRVRILACSAALDVFNQPLFMEAARRIKDRGAEITLFTGPVLVDRGDGFSGPEQLADEHVLTLVQDVALNLINHLHIVDQEEGVKLYLEGVHRSLLVEPRGRFRYNPERFTAWEWQRQTKIFANRFDGFVNLVVETKQKHPAAYQALPIRIKKESLEEIARLSQETHTDLAFLTASQLLDLPIVRQVLI